MKRKHMVFLIVLFLCVMIVQGTLASAAMPAVPVPGSGEAIDPQDQLFRAYAHIADFQLIDDALVATVAIDDVPEDALVEKIDLDLASNQELEANLAADITAPNARAVNISPFEMRTPVRETAKKGVEDSADQTQFIYTALGISPSQERAPVQGEWKISISDSAQPAQNVKLTGTLVVYYSSNTSLPESSTANFASSSPIPILLVDDDDNNPDVRQYYTDALDDLGVDYVVWDTNNSDFEPDAAFLDDFQAVIWFTGDELGGYAGPGSAAEAALGGWLDYTGYWGDDDHRCLLISSQDYHWDRGLTSFMSNYLGVDSVVEDAADPIFIDGVGTVFSGLGPYALTFPFSDYSDIVHPDGTAETAFIANGSTDVGVMKVIEDDYTHYLTAFLGFPIEATGYGDRIEILDRFTRACGPEIDVSPTSLNMNVPRGETADDTMYITNLLGELDWDINVYTGPADFGGDWTMTYDMWCDGSVNGSDPTFPELIFGEDVYFTVDKNYFTFANDTSGFSIWGDGYIAGNHMAGGMTMEDGSWYCWEAEKYSGIGGDWLAVSPDSGTTSGSTTDPVTVSVDSYWFSVGEYGLLVIHSNDGDEAMIAVPVTVDISTERPGDDIFWYAAGPATDYLALSNGSGAFSYLTKAVSGTYIPLVGNFGGTAADDIFWYKPGIGMDYFWAATGGGSFSESAVSVSGTYEPILGDYNRSGTTDIFWYAAGPGQDWVAMSYGQGSFSYIAQTVNGTYIPLVGNFAGDWGDDIFWYAPGPSPDYLFTSYTTRYGGGFSSTSVPVSGTYEPFVGNFNGDIYWDIFWYAPGSDPDWLALSNGNGTFTYLPKNVNGTYTPLAGNFAGSAATDIFWYKPGSGMDYLWTATANGNFSETALNVAGTYEPVLGDYNLDGFLDIFWYASGPAADWLALSNGNGTFSYLPQSISGNYTPFVGNFDGSSAALQGPISLSQERMPKDVGIGH